MTVLKLWNHSLRGQQMYAGYWSEMEHCCVGIQQKDKDKDTGNNWSIKCLSSWLKMNQICPYFFYLSVYISLHKIKLALSDMTWMEK